MTSSAQVLREIEELRRQLNQGFGTRYDPERLQTLAPLSQELDRLTVELARQEFAVHGLAAKP